MTPKSCMGGRRIIRVGMIDRDGGDRLVEVRVRGGENGGMMIEIEKRTKGEDEEII